MEKICVASSTKMGLGLLIVHVIVIIIIIIHVCDFECLVNIVVLEICHILEKTLHKQSTSESTKMKFTSLTQRHQ